MTEDRTLGRIAALLRQAEGTDNAHEADAFLQAAQRLATAASIDLALARAHSADREKRSQPIQKKVEIGAPGSKGLRTFVELFLAISHANDVRCDIASNSSAVYCFGFPGDISMCEALYASVAVQMVRSSDAYIKSGRYRSETITQLVRDRGRWGERTTRWEQRPVHASTARVNFQQAYARRIGARLQEGRAAARSEAMARPDAGRSGVTSTELVLRGKELELRDFHKANSRAKGTWKGARAKAGYSEHARMAGDRAARDARLVHSGEIGGARPALGDGISM